MKPRRRYALRGFAVLVSVLSASGLHAGSAWAESTAPSSPLVPGYDIGKALREAHPSPGPNVPVPQAPAPPLVQEPEEPLSLPSDGVLLVREFTLEGAEAIPESELQQLLAPYRGQNLSMAQIEQAASKITTFYRSRGYLVARAYVPKQDASAGRLRIRVLVGHYGTFRLKNQSSVADALIKSAFTPLVDSRSPVSLSSLERSMLLVGDMPGARLPVLTISAGQSPGSSDLQVDVSAGPVGTAYIMADNYGSRYTGKNRMSAGVEVNSPLGIADQLSVSALGSDHGGLLSARLACGLPLGISGLRAAVSLARTTYELGGAYRDIEASGTGSSIEGSLSYPLLRRKKRNFYLGMRVSYRRLHDTIGAVGSSTTRTAAVASLTPRYEEWATLLGRGVYATMNAAVVEGRLAFADAEQEAFNRAGANTVGNYVYLRLAAASQVELLQKLDLTVAVSAQKSLNKNLDASEQMILTGPDGVRAYRTIIGGDNGYLVSGELRYAMAVPSLLGGTFRHFLGVFGDAGGVHLQHGGYSNLKGARLQDVGAGYYLYHGSLFGTVKMACALGSRLSSSGDESRSLVLLQAGVSI